jgi:hypothetical protein
MALPTSPRALVLRTEGPVVSYALVRRPLGSHLGDADTAPAGSPTVDTAARRLANAVRDLVAGRPGAGAELVPFGIQLVVAQSPTARRIYPDLGRSTTLTVLPVPGATVWKSVLRTGELTVLNGTSAITAAAGGLAAGAPTALPAGEGSARVRLPAGSTQRLVVLAEPAGGQWHATLGRTSLHRATAYGWAQAFVVPAGATGLLHVYASNGARSFWLWIELLVLLLIVAIGIIPTPQSAAGPRAGEPRRLPPQDTAGGSAPDDTAGAP